MGEKRIYSGTKRERDNQASKKYRQTEKGKATVQKYQQTGRRKIANKKYNQTDKGKEYRREYNLKQNYGLTLAEYDQVFEKQNGVCAICKQLDITCQRLSVDHNHKTGKVRGLLCHRCNLLLGIYENDCDLFKEFKKYLKRAKSTQYKKPGGNRPERRN